ncbi:MAG: hypothetical protein Q4A82_07710 [Corynebacterium sp.]|nr:hypothetical protein [Corynebacterium sp.]
MMKPVAEWDRVSWLALVSLIISTIALVFPFILGYGDNPKGFWDTT